MKPLLYSCFLLMFSMTSIFAQTGTKPETTKLLRHVVIFKFKDSSSAADIQKVADTFFALKK